MVLGLGTGSTAVFALRRVGERLAEGGLADVKGIPTSKGAAATAANLGIPMTSLEEHPVIDLTIDGADEVDPALNLIKGGGGALLREKIVAQASRREVIVVDSSKCSPRLGTLHSVPVEVIEFGWRPVALHLESQGANVTRRAASDGSPFRTDQGNLILDCDFGSIQDPEEMERRLIARAGVVAVGLFCGLATELVIGSHDGVEHRTRRP